MDDLFIVFFFWMAWGILSALVASGKERSAASWFFIGILFGPFGFIASLIVSTPEQATSEQQPQMNEAHPVENDNDFKKCPLCAEKIRLEAIFCRFCGNSITDNPPEHKQDNQEINQLVRNAIDEDQYFEIRSLISKGADPEEIYRGISHLNYAELYGKSNAKKALEKDL